MRATATQILDGVQRYIDEEILAKIPDARKWVIGGYIALLMQPYRRDPASLFSHPLIAPLGHLINADGTADIDAIREVLLEQARRYPSFINIPTLGPYNMDAGDVDKLYNYIIS